MKSDHRHELKTNELAEWIANFPQWARDNGKIVIGVSVVAALVIGSALWYWRKTNVELVEQQLEFTNLIAKIPQNKIQVLMAQSSGRDTSIMLIETAVALETVANGTQDENMAALALIKRAESLRAREHYRQETVNPADLRTAVEGAKVAYTKAVSMAENNPPLMAMARFGLGLCEEEIGKFNEAEKIYRELIENSDFEGTTAVVRAQRRLETMDDYKKRIVFKPAPIPKQPIPDMTDLLPPIPLRPIEVNEPNDFPVVPEVMIGPEPNPGIVVPDVGIQPEPNAVSESIKIKLRPQAPNNVMGVVDTNVPGE
jgi:tetratricopeptide (TPR) repeat protein